MVNTIENQALQEAVVTDMMGLALVILAFFVGVSLLFHGFPTLFKITKCKCNCNGSCGKGIK